MSEMDWWINETFPSLFCYLCEEDFVLSEDFALGINSKNHKLGKGASTIPIWSRESPALSALCCALLGPPASFSRPAPSRVLTNRAPS